MAYTPGPPAPPSYGPPSGWQQPPSAPAPKGKRRWLIPTGTLVLGMVIGSASHGSSGSVSTATASTATVTSTATTTETARPVAGKAAAPAPAAAKPADAGPGFSGDGTYAVGSDIQPGTYRSAKPDGAGCYWARLKDTSGGFGAIIANGNSAGQVTVTIRKTDGAFETSGCADWVRTK